MVAKECRALEINNLWDWKLQRGKSSEDFKALTA